MSSNYLILDVPNLLHRRFHALKGSTLGTKSKGTILYGFFVDLLFLMKTFPGSKALFCFDSGKSKRCQLLPRYKYSRTPNPEIETPLSRLKDSLLSSLGFRNVFCEPGVEADDWIGRISKTGNNHNHYTIVSNDSDFYQLLKDSVTIWNPHQKCEFGLKWLYEQYGMTPDEWVVFKALTGCKADGVPGIPRVGTVTAKAFLAGDLVESDKGFQRIKNGIDTMNLNKRLVTVPFDMLNLDVQIKLDELDDKKWRKVMMDEGFYTLVDQFGGLS
jgi:DNA polymerase I